MTEQLLDNFSNMVSLSGISGHLKKGNRPFDLCLMWWKLVLGITFKRTARETIPTLPIWAFITSLRERHIRILRLFFVSLLLHNYKQLDREDVTFIFFLLIFV